MMKEAHFAILDLLLASSNDIWVVVPMTMSRDYHLAGRAMSEQLIVGRRPALKHLNDLGLVQVRTVTIRAWYSPLSDRPVDGFSDVEVQAMLTPQGRDVALSRRLDGVSVKGRG